MEVLAKCEVCYKCLKLEIYLYANMKRAESEKIKVISTF